MEFNYSLSDYTPISNFTTTGLFEEAYTDSNKSAIDDFTAKRSSLFGLMKPYASDMSKLPYALTNMIFLGCISAVESYIRKIIRNTINIDAYSKKNCEEQTLKYGAVLFQQDISMLPEALLEQYSFSDGKNIRDTIYKFLNINCDSNSSLKETLHEYSMICQLRHCVVHRFGLLGTNNAIKLGLSEHQKYLEKPLKIDFDHLNQIVQVCENVVKVINSHLFCKILQRSFEEKTEIWFFDYRKDKKTFMKYYNIFNDSSSKNDPKQIYKYFLDTMQKIHGKKFQSATIH